MRIKHFSGYGLVNAKKVNKQINGNNVTLTINVTGNHEMGLTRPFHDPYLICNWLVKKFEKKPVNYLSVSYNCYSDYVLDDYGLDTETATYVIDYETE